MKVATIIGARPQFIKAAVLSRRFRETSDIDEIIIHTGQHYDQSLSDVFFAELDIPYPHFNLDIRSASHGAQTGRMLEGIETILAKERPDYVIVYGDTNSTLAGALAAAKLGLVVVHVEAGLRSFNRIMPEEINRVLTDHLSDILFAPTVNSAAQLRREGLSDERVFVVGDIMLDSIIFNRQRSLARSKILADHNLRAKGYILATIHRAENTGDPNILATMIKGLSDSAKATNLTVVWPVHPRTRKLMNNHSATMPHTDERLRLIEPIGYLDMLALEDNARVIATDSGGVQKEAFFCKVPCVTLREETEWVELVESGWNRLASAQSAKSIADTVVSALAAPPTSAPEFYGNGSTGEKILEILLSRQSAAKTPPRDSRIR